jgi:hypothetical protein
VPVAMSATAWWPGQVAGPGETLPVGAVHALYLWRFARSVWLLDDGLRQRLRDQVLDALP